MLLPGFSGYLGRVLPGLFKLFWPCFYPDFQVILAVFLPGFSGYFGRVFIFYVISVIVTVIHHTSGPSEDDEAVAQWVTVWPPRVRSPFSSVGVGVFVGFFHLGLFT